jgi:hypothetical protein
LDAVHPAFASAVRRSPGTGGVLRSWPADGRGCRIPVLLDNAGNAPVQRIGVIVQARDGQRRFFEEQRFQAEREPVIDRQFFKAELRFAPDTCRAMRSVVVTGASCGGTDRPPGPCGQDADLIDESGGGIRFHLR